MIARLHALAKEAGARAMVRCGLGLYGVCLPLEPDEPADERLRPRLHPVLTWKTTITSILEVAAGASVGYGATFTAQQPMRLALLPVGYADGLRRSLSGTNDQSGGWVMIHHRRAPIVGRVSMNLTTVDVSGIETRPQAGDEVILLGDGVTAEDHGRIARCLAYEILCGLRGVRISV
jgi:alanine racemase